MRNTITIVACIALMLVTDTATSSSRIIDIVDELSSSTYAGRLTGTPGNELASHYVATHFTQLGLEPLRGLDDYYQQYSQPTRFLNGSPELAIVADQGALCESLQYLKDFHVAVGQGLTNEGTVEGPGVILHAVEHLSSGTTGLSDLRESILLIPEHVFLPNQTAIMQRLMTTSSKPAGIIIEADIGDQFFPAPLFVNPAEWETPTQLPLLFSARTEVFQELVEAVENASELKMAADYELTEIKVNNVLGIIPGNLEESSDDKHEYVIIGAHFDGAGNSMTGSFNPGAHDNASGVAVLLECAARLKRDNVCLEPTVVFVAFNGEEQGMYGARYLATNLPYPKAATRMINIDSVGAQTSERLSIDTCLGAESAMQDALLAYSHELGIPAITGHSNGSDHRSFADEGITAISLVQSDSSVMHRPSDTLDVLSEEKLEQVVSLILTYLQQM
jgi:aminopeptidase YwaD